MRRIVTLLLLGLAGIGIVSWAANYLSTGKVQVTTPNKTSAITLQNTSDNGTIVKIGTGSLEATIKHGQYAAIIKNGSQTKTQFINFQSGHKTFRYSISLAKPLKTEPVLSQVSQAVAANDNKLLYLNGSGAVYQIDGQNNLSPTGIQQQFQAIKWVGTSFGVGQDSNRHLYVITNGSSFTSLKVPFSYDNKPVNFTVAPDKTIYVSHGMDIYMGNRTGNFKKIFTASGSNPTLAAGVGEVAVSDSKYGGSPSGASKSSLATINNSGKKYKKGVEAERIFWSPNGHSLVTYNQSAMTIYNASLRQIAVIPTSSAIGQALWVDNSRLLYTLNNQIWLYNLSSQQTQLFANALSSDNITGLYLSDDEAYTYITTSGNALAIKRVSLDGQHSANYVYNLQNSLPVSYDQYSIGYVGFAFPPTILIQTYADSSPGNYVQQAQANMQSFGFNIDQLRFQLGSPSSGN